MNATSTAEHVNLLRSAGHHVIVNVDGGGGGGGVIDRLRSVGFDVNEVQFSARAFDPKKYANRRAEIWGAMKEWLKVGALPDDEDLAVGLTSPEYDFNAQDQIQLERKESMKAKGMASPDSADALAVTFAVAVSTPMDEHIGVAGDGQLERQRRELLDYNPAEHQRKATLWIPR